MRKINEETIKNFLNSVAMKKQNRQVYSQNEKTFLLLHGNCIATIENKNGMKVLSVSNCGWNTPTTNALLNSIPNVSVHNSKGNLFLNDCKWNGEERIVCDLNESKTLEVRI